jgi:hypothetical protein
MTTHHVRTLTHLTATLTAAIALSACELEDKADDPKPTQDMHVEQDMSPDSSPDATPDVDQSEDMPVVQELLLKGVRMEGSRVVEAALPEEIVLLLDVEGSSERTQQVSVTFTAGDKELMQSVTYGANTLTITPPALPEHRGPVAVSVTLNGTTVALDGGLSYGAALDDLSPADAPTISALPGIQRADSVWHMADDVILVRQRPTQGPAPTPNLLTLEDTDDTFAAFKLVDGVATPIGAPLTLRAEHVVRDGERLILKSRAADAATERIDSLSMTPAGLVQTALGITIPAGHDVLSLAAYDDVIYLLTEHVDADGARKVELTNTTTGKVFGHPRLDAMEEVSIVPMAAGSDADGAAPVLMGRNKINGDVECVLIDDAQSVALFGTLHSGDGAAPHAPDATLVVHAGKLYLGYSVATAAGHKLEVGVLSAEGDVVKFAPTISYVDSGAQHTPLFANASAIANASRAVPPSILCGSADNRKPVRPRVGGLRDRLSRASITKLGQSRMTLPVNGDAAQFNAVMLQGEPGSEAYISRITPQRDGRIEVTEVSGGKIATYTYDPAAPVSFKDGHIRAGGDRLLSAASANSGAVKRGVALTLKVPTLVEDNATGVMRLDTNFAVLLNGSNNITAHTSPLYDSKGLDVQVSLYSGGARLIVTTPGGSTGVMTIEEATLDTIKDGEQLRVGTNAGLTLLPQGFVIAQLIIHGEDAYFLGAKSAASEDASLYHVRVNAKGKGEVATPTEIMSANELREVANDDAAAFDRLILGDVDPMTPTPGVIALVYGGGLAVGRRQHKPLVITKNMELSSPTLPRNITGAGVVFTDDSTLSISGGDLTIQDGSAFMMGWVGGSINAPASITFTAEGARLTELPLVGVSPAIMASLADEALVDEEGARTLVLDINGDGLPDALVKTTPPEVGGSSYDYLLIGQPGGGFTPILAPDNLLYGALLLAPTGPREAAALAEVVATTHAR